MRLKKAFTLAEILIVLMVIGVIATMTVPSLMKGVNDATYKTAYKKAFNAVTNIAAVEKISGQLPADGSATSVLNFFSSLNNNLSVKEYVQPPQTNFTSNINASEALQEANTGVQKIKFIDKTFGSSEISGDGTTMGTGTRSPWIVSEDGLAYAVIPASGSNTTTACRTKLFINSQTDLAQARTASCLVVVVDVNGLAKTPNRIEAQVANGLNADAKMDQFTGDRFYIYVGSDGVAAGPKTVTVSGRLMADMK